MVIRGEEGVSVLYLKDFLGLLFPLRLPPTSSLPLDTLLDDKESKLLEGKTSATKPFLWLREKYEGMKESRERLRFFVRRDKKRKESN